MPGLVTGIHVFFQSVREVKTWMAETRLRQGSAGQARPAMTKSPTIPGIVRADIAGPGRYIKRARHVQAFGVRMGLTT